MGFGSFIISVSILKIQKKKKKVTHNIVSLRHVVNKKTKNNNNSKNNNPFETVKSYDERVSFSE